MSPADPTAALPPLPRRRRRWPWIVLGIIAFLGFAAGFIWQSAPSFVGREVVRFLRDAGFAEPELHIRSIGPYRAVVENVRLGSELKVEELELRYSPGTLRHRRVTGVTVRGLDLAVDLRGNAPALGSLQQPLSALLAGGSGGAGTIPEVTVEDSRIALDTPVGTIAVSVDGKVQPTSLGDFEAAFAANAETPFGTVNGEVAFAGSPGGPIEGTVTVGQSRLQVGENAVADLAGEASFALEGSTVARASGRFDLAGLRIGQASFASGTLGFDLADHKATAALRLSDESGQFIVALDATVTSPQTTADLTGTLDVTAGPQAALWPLLGLPAPTEGTARLSLKLSGAAGGFTGAAPPIQRAAIPFIEAVALPPLAASLAFELQGLTWPKFATKVSGAGAFDIGLDANGVRLVAPNPTALTGTPDADRLADLGMPPEIATQLARPLSVTVAVPEPLAFAPETGRATGRIDLALAAEGGLSATAQTTPVLDLAGGSIRRYALHDTVLSVSKFRWDGTLFETLRVAGFFSGEAGTLLGEARVDAATPDLQLGGFRATDAALSADTQLIATPDGVTLSLSGTENLLRGHPVLPPAADVGSLNIPLLPAEGPLLQFDFAEGGGVRLEHDVATGPVSLTKNLGTRQDPLRLVARLSRLRAKGSWSAGEGYALDADTGGGTLRLPERQLSAGGVALGLSYRSGGKPLEVAYTVTRLAYGAEEGTVPPLAMRGTASLAGGKLRFSATGSAAAKALQVAISGDHDLASGSGKAEIDIKPVSFAPDGVQPSDLAPAVAPGLSAVTGTIGLTGTIGWDREGLSPRLALALKDLSLTLAGAEIRGINGVLAIDGLAPLSTPEHQQIAIGAIQMGLSFTDGLLTFDMNPGFQLKIESGIAKLAGGEVRVVPATLDLDSGRQELRLVVSDVSLEQLLAVADLEGLSGTGILDGEIPVLLEGSAVIVDGGVLAAEAPGLVRYAPAQPPGGLDEGGESVNLALNALRDFHYKQLALTVDRGADGEMQVGLHIDGNNPAFYEGYPVQFNLAVTGKLDQVLSRSLAGYRIPDSIRERLTTFGQ